MYLKKKNYLDNNLQILDKILNSIEERFIPNENILKDCSWLDPKMYEYIEKLEEYPMDILITVTKLSNVNRDSVLLELTIAKLSQITLPFTFSTGILEVGEKFLNCVRCSAKSSK